MIQIEHTLQLLSECVDRAEREAVKRVRETHHRADEPLLTHLFCDTLNRELRDATDDRLLAIAFAADLMRAFSYLDSHAAEACAGHLFMDCEKHGSQSEKKSGGDFGFTISRPVFHGTHISTDEQGLLCQAKLKTRTRGWGTLTKNQQKVLPKNLDYTCLALYEYHDKSRRELKPFRWQSCYGETVTTVGEWLRKGEFPSPMPTADIVEKLGVGTIGTSDRAIIEQVIARKDRPRLTIRIDWPDGQRPHDIHQFVTTSQPLEQLVHVYVRR